MNQLEHLTTHDIWCPSEEYPSPGVFVQHTQDNHSLGMIIARVGVDLLVLWSVLPDEDAAYVREKLYAALKIPRTYLGFK